MIRHGLPRVTILGMMTTVFVCGVILGCIVEIRRIKRAQAFFGQQAAYYAQRERIERNTLSFFLNSALSDKRLAENMKQSIERSRFRVGDRWGQADIDRRLLMSKLKLYEAAMESGRQCLLYAQNARVEADRLSLLRCDYAEAASCWWLPFAPSPMSGRHPETEGSASSRKSVLLEKKLKARPSSTKEPTKPANPQPDIGQPPFGFRWDENVGPCKESVINDKKGATERLTEMILDLGHTHIDGDEIAGG
jgi:hypothetical protein